jgi:hypothetical protein
MTYRPRKFVEKTLDNHDADAMRHVQQMRANSLNEDFSDARRIAAKEAADLLERQLLLECKLLNDPIRWMRIYGRIRK